MQGAARIWEWAAKVLHTISVIRSAEADVAVRPRELQVIKHQCAQVYQQLWPRLSAYITYIAKQVALVCLRNIKHLCLPGSKMIDLTF
jgi:hypothetical protein